MWHSLTTHHFPVTGHVLAIHWPWLLVLLLLLALYGLTRCRSRPKNDHQRGARADRDDALRLLRARRDSGAISQEEYDRLRRTVDP